MTAQNRAPLTDSPWFWLLAFALMAILAVAAISGKYGRRQSREERKYQVAERIAAGETGPAAESKAAGRRSYATPGNTLIPLWPLTLIMTTIALIAAAMLYRSQQAVESTDREDPS
jgi:membrane protein implicated in regulation of membrane protease activity